MSGPDEFRPFVLVLGARSLASAQTNTVLAKVKAALRRCADLPRIAEATDGAAPQATPYACTFRVFGRREAVQTLAQATLEESDAPLFTDAAAYETALANVDFSRALGVQASRDALALYEARAGAAAAASLDLNEEPLGDSTGPGMKGSPTRGSVAAGRASTTRPPKAPMPTAAARASKAAVPAAERAGGKGAKGGGAAPAGPWEAPEPFADDPTVAAAAATIRATIAAAVARWPAAAAPAPGGSVDRGAEGVDRPMPLLNLGSASSAGDGGLPSAFPPIAAARLDQQQQPLAVAAAAADVNGQCTAPTHVYVVVDAPLSCAEAVALLALGSGAPLGAAAASGPSAAGPSVSPRDGLLSARDAATAARLSALPPVALRVGAVLELSSLLDAPIPQALEAAYAPFPPPDPVELAWRGGAVAAAAPSLTSTLAVASMVPRTESAAAAPRRGGGAASVAGAAAPSGVQRSATAASAVSAGPGAAAAAAAAAAPVVVLGPAPPLGPPALLRAVRACFNTRTGALTAREVRGTSAGRDACDLGTHALSSSFPPMTDRGSTPGPT